MGVPVFIVLLFMIFLCACDSLSDPPPVDVCNDRAGDECGHIDNKFKLQQCENAVFDSCMDELAR